MACLMLLLLMLLLMASASSSSVETVERHGSDLSAEHASAPSPYHRKLLTTEPETPAAKEKEEKWSPFSVDGQRNLWPTWWNASMEERLKNEILIGIVTTRYVLPFPADLQ